jgi:dynein light chain roadblock-type
MLVSRGHPVSIIRHSGVIFEGEQGRRYASVVGKTVENVQGGLEEVAGESDVVVSLFVVVIKLGH